MNYPKTASLPKTRLQLKTKEIRQSLPLTVTLTNDNPSTPPSPGTNEYVKTMKTTSQKQGWKELKQLRAINGGTLPHGAVINLVRKYDKRGTSFLTEDHLRYRLRAVVLDKDDDRDDETTKTPTQSLASLMLVSC